MAQHTDTPGFASVFKKCARCDYSLRGLPAGPCPECGLRFDERCSIYRATNPRQALVAWLMLLISCSFAINKLPHLANLSGASGWDIFGAIMGLLCLPFVALGLWALLRRYRRGFAVAITGDGLIMHLPAMSSDLLPWDKIRRAIVKDQPPDKPQIARLLLVDTDNIMEIGGTVNVFPDRLAVERFVTEVNARVDVQPDTST